MLSNTSNRNLPSVAFAQLFGMGNAVSSYVSSRGFLNYKYVPYGEISDLVPYMLRRAKENSAFSDMAANEAEMYFNALVSRKNR
jgi:proline dehydrogenase